MTGRLQSVHSISFSLADCGLTVLKLFIIFLVVVYGEVGEKVMIQCFGNVEQKPSINAVFLVDFVDIGSVTKYLSCQP